MAVGDLLPRPDAAVTSQSRELHSALKALVGGGLSGLVLGVVTGTTLAFASFRQRSAGS